MMERKAKYMPVWGRYVDILDKLPREQLGELFHAMMHYHFDDAEPELSGVLSIYWDFMKPDLDNARSSYEKKVESGRKGGKRSAEVRSNGKPSEATERETKQTEAQASKKKEPEQITITESRSESITQSISRSESKTETRTTEPPGSAPASGEADISSEKKDYGEFGWIRLSDSQYRRLRDQMGEQTLDACIHYIDCSAQSTGNRNCWKDWYLVLRRCYEEGWYQRRWSAPVRKDPIPMGASGELGQAELEAIQQTLRRELPDIPIAEQEEDHVSRYFKL